MYTKPPKSSQQRKTVTENRHTVYDKPINTNRIEYMSHSQKMTAKGNTQIADITNSGQFDVNITGHCWQEAVSYTM